VRRPHPLLFAALLLAACLAAGLPACVDDDSPRGVWRRHCARCHGLDGRGNPRAVDAKPGLDLTLSKLAAADDRVEIRRRIVEGEGVMPAFGDKLTPRQVEEMVALSLELAGHAAGADPAVPPR
jgi:mono/diheme cytochrome c family protein